jgi:DNA-binding HxlR family transcriptional regulator
MSLPCDPKGCPMDAILRLLMGPWTTYILWNLRTNGPTRFGELKRRVGGVSAKMLTERLRLLESAGIVSREYEPTIPPQVTYALTTRGNELSGVFAQLNEIAIRWRAQDERRARKAVKAA